MSNTGSFLESVEDTVDVTTVEKVKDAKAGNRPMIPEKPPPAPVARIV